MAYQLGMKLVPNILLAILFAGVVASAGETPRPDPARFQDEVAAIAAKEPEKGGIIFTGSSSIRLWKDLAGDFSGLPVHNHGFGGSVANDIIVHFDALIGRHEPKLVVLYTGSNDIHHSLGSDEVFADYRKLLDLIHEQLPEARVVLNSIKIAGSRSGEIPQVHEVNARLKAWADETPWARYVESTNYLADDQGGPERKYYANDFLHLNELGYAEWRKILEPVVREEWEKVR